MICISLVTYVLYSILNIYSFFSVFAILINFTLFSLILQLSSNFFVEYGLIYANRVYNSFLVFNYRVLVNC